MGLSIYSKSANSRITIGLIATLSYRSMIKNQLWEQAALLLAVGSLIGSCLFIIAPFVPTLLWAAIMSFTTWNIFQKLSKKLGGRDTLAASLLVGLMLVLIVLPLIYALIGFAAQVNEFYVEINAKIQNGLPPLPIWLSDMPLIGRRLETSWNALAAGDPVVKERVRELLLWASRMLLHAGKIAGQGFGVLLMSCILVLFFYIGGVRGRFWLEGALRNIGGQRAIELMNLAGRTIKSVVFGILGTAAAQGLLAVIGFAIAGVPMPIALGLATAILSLIPGGPAILWIPAAIWLHHNGATGWAVFITAWGAVVVGAADNILRPLLIGKGADLPLLLILIGVLGGAINFGLLGVFLGPTILAVGFAALRDWIETRKPSPAAHFE